MALKKRDKLAIVGWAATSRDQAPFGDEQFDIWGCNELGMVLPDRRWDVWFNLHKAVEILPDNRKWLAAQTVPVILLEPVEGVPNGIIFPFDLVFERFGRYFTNSIAFQIALAIMEGYRTIHIYGVDMALDSEYQYQRPCCEYFIGLARGMGIDLFIPEQSDLLKTPYIYGLEQPIMEEGFIREADIRERQRVIQSEHQKAMKNLYQYEGAMMQNDFWLARYQARKRELGKLAGAATGAT